MKLACITLLVALLLCSCSIMPKDDRMMRSADFFNRFSRTTLIATKSHKFGGEKLKLRKNHTFTYRSDVMGIKDSYYCGRYLLEGNVLLLEFAEDRKPADIDCVMVLRSENGWPVFKGARSSLYVNTTDEITETIKSVTTRRRR